jgi:hypothetical protein
MSKITILENDTITVWYHTEKKIIHHEIHKFCFGKRLRDALTAGAEAMSKYGALKWLSDDRNNGPVTTDDETWGREIWFPQAIRAGWKYWAMVPPKKVVGQMNIARIIKIYSDMGITAQVFHEAEEAFAWLDGF